MREADYEHDVFGAIDRILWWGAGNRAGRLFSANIDWLRHQNDNGSSAKVILDSAEAAFDANPFDDQIFRNPIYRSNAEYTKIYALMKDDFVIYDSRVAAAIGILVVLYCEDPNRDLPSVPDNLRFGRTNASGEDNRNAGRGAYSFPVCAYSNPSIHALSNWRANAVVPAAVELLGRENRRPA